MKKDNISIDIGNGYLKAVNQEGEMLHFPTVIKENHDINILGESQNDYSATINGIKYYIGNLAIAKRGIRQWQSDKVLNADTEKYVALCSHILSPEDAPKITLCLGLPYSYYITLNRGEHIKTELTGKTLATIYNGVEKTITIESVSVYPQGVGAYFSSLYDLTGKAIRGAAAHIKAMFIDIGYRTVDIVSFDSLNNTFVLIEENSFSLDDCGIFSAINDIASYLNSTGNTASPNDIEYAIQNNKSVYESMYGDTDFKDAEEAAYRTLAERITTEINLKLSGEIQRYKNIFLTGGGAGKLYPHMSKTYPNLKLQDDFLYCNAKGYLALENTKEEQAPTQSTSAVSQTH